MAKNIVADSGYWFALFDERDNYHEEASVIEEIAEIHSLIIPWPTLYETINTRFSRRKHNVTRRKRFLDLPSTVLIDDEPYRDASLEFIFNDKGHAYSLVDHLIRSMLVDTTLSIDAFISFNPKDFYDVCHSRGIEMLYP